MNCIVAALVVAAGLAGMCAPAGAAEGRDEASAPESKVAWKFTPTWYNSSNETNAWDLNLRGNTDTQTWWVGYYYRSRTR